MRELDRALADIETIRQQIARQDDFCGYGPATLAATGFLAAAVAVAQSISSGAAQDPDAYFEAWIATAVVSALLVGAETMMRSKHMHSKLADAKIFAAAVDFVPAGMAGTALFVALKFYEPGAMWMLPGVWQMMLALGFFAASRSLPRAMTVVGGWYLATGFATLAVASASHTLSPWAMGLPFAVGQILAAALLRRNLEHGDEP
jgi:hypothetical protein